MARAVGGAALLAVVLQGPVLGQAPPVPGAAAPPSSAVQPPPPGPWRVDPPPLAPAAPPVAPAATGLPRDLAPWGMFLAADVVVKAVMVGLAVASVLTWTVWLAKSLELAGARRRARRHLRALEEACSLPELVAERGAVPVMLAAAGRELERSAALSADGVKERLALVLQRIEAAAGLRMTRGTGLLATVGSTAPFVGLFGTVWGIMNSFVGIAEAQTTNLAVVAPGIAEALLATALGLVAAIPAVVIYNGFARGIARYRALLGDASAEILRHVSRDLDRGRTRPMLHAAE